MIKKWDEPYDSVEISDEDKARILRNIRDYLATQWESENVIIIDQDTPKQIIEHLSDICISAAKGALDTDAEMDRILGIYTATDRAQKREVRGQLTTEIELLLMRYIVRVAAQSLKIADRWRSKNTFSAVDILIDAQSDEERKAIIVGRHLFYNGLIAADILMYTLSHDEMQSILELYWEIQWNVKTEHLFRLSSIVHSDSDFSNLVERFVDEHEAEKLEIMSRAQFYRLR
jgi:hypothetical protein